MDRTKRSACALQFGARTGVWTTWIPAERRNASTGPLHFRSRSQISTEHGCKTPSTSSVRCRMACNMKASSGCGVEPTLASRHCVALARCDALSGWAGFSTSIIARLREGRRIRADSLGPLLERVNNATSEDRDHRIASTAALRTRSDGGMSARYHTSGPYP